MNKTRVMFWCIVSFILGNIFKDLIWYLRIQTPILKREMLMALNSGEPYFLDCFFINLQFVIMMGGIMFVTFFIIGRIIKRKAQKDTKMQKESGE